MQASEVSLKNLSPTELTTGWSPGQSEGRGDHQTRGGQRNLARPAARELLARVETDLT